MVNCIYQANNLLDESCNFVAKDIVLPTIKATYQTAADLSLAVSGIFSKSLQKMAENIFYDPINADKILFVSTRIEMITAHLASQKPLEWNSFAHYLSRSVIGINQNLHAYTKRINDLLRVPENLKSFLRRFSFDSVMDRLEATAPTYLRWLNRTITEIKRFSLAVLEVAIRILDLAFRTFFLGADFGPFSYLKEIITNARKNLYGRLADATIESIEKKETKLRRTIYAGVGEAVTDYLGERLTSITIKSALGLLFYLPTKDLLRDSLNAPEWAIHILGLSILTRVLWSAVVKPTCDPYFEAYNPKYHPEGVSFFEFCNYFGLQAFYPLTALAGGFFGNSLPKDSKEESSNENFLGTFLDF